MILIRLLFITVVLLAGNILAGQENYDSTLVIPDWLRPIHNNRDVPQRSAPSFSVRDTSRLIITVDASRLSYAQFRSKYFTVDLLGRDTAPLTIDSIRPDTVDTVVFLHVYCSSNEP